MEITISGKSVNYDVMGSGAPILFVHGWGGDRNSLKGIAEELQETNKCYLIDLPGFGNSDAPDSDWGIESYSDLVKKFILELNISPVIYVGHSFGGALGVDIAANDAEIIDKLVLISPSYRRPLAKRAKSYSPSAIKKLLSPIRKLAYRVLYPNSVALKYSNLESNFRRIVSTDLTDEIRKIKARTLIIWPVDDVDVPLNDAYVLHNGIKGSVLKLFANYGHDLPLIHPDLVADKIKEFTM